MTTGFWPARLGRGVFAAAFGMCLIPGVQAKASDEYAESSRMGGIGANALSPAPATISPIPSIGKDGSGHYPASRQLKIKSHHRFLRLQASGRENVPAVCAAILGTYALAIEPRPVGNCSSVEWVDKRRGDKFYSVNFSDELSASPDFWKSNHDGYAPWLSYSLDAERTYCDDFIFVDLLGPDNSLIRIITTVSDATGIDAGGQLVGTLPKSCE